MASDLQSLARLGMDSYCSANIKRSTDGVAPEQSSTRKMTVEASEQREPP